MVMSPSEYTGEGGTCVYGRCVLSRGPFSPEQHEGGWSNKSGKGKKGKKGRDGDQEKLKTEIHILGGSGMGEVLFIEGWADGARQLAQALQRGQVYRIKDAKKIDSKPRFSTSKLDYYLRVVPPIGVNTKIEVWVEGPSVPLPSHHPFVDLQSLQRVAGSIRVSLIGVVSTQPGLVTRETKYGPGEVCNAGIQQKEHLVRCGFWRTHGQSLSEYPVGTAVVLHQVNVYTKNGGWEVSSTESTIIEECPQELREPLLSETNLEAGGTSLTQRLDSVDYNTTKTIPATLSGLASVIAPQAGVRDLRGTFEVHSVAVLGVSSVLSDGSFHMRSCVKCKALVREELNQCDKCAESDGLENRWIFSIDMADQGGAATNVMLYHDAAKEIPFLDTTDETIDDNRKLKIIRSFRSKPWSVRVVFRKNEMKQTNYLEIKKMEPTLTTEGAVGSFRLLPAPCVASQDACPFARCADVSFDVDLGVLTVNGLAVQAVRLLVVILPPAEDELVGTPDSTNLGFRITRKVKCGLADQCEDTYEVKFAGIDRSVQWLMTAPEDACYLITAKGRGTDKAFSILTYEDTKSIGRSEYHKLMTRHIEHKSDVSIVHSIMDTPQKRFNSLSDAVPLADTPRPLNKRRKFE